MEDITTRIREEAQRLLNEKAVDLVVGYRQSWDENVTSACFVTDTSQVDQLIYDEHCTHNLTKCLVGREGRLTTRFAPANGKPRVAVVATPAALRSLVGLIKEHQFKREDVMVLGIVDGTPVGLVPDVEVGRIPVNGEARKSILDEIQRIEQMEPGERWELWEREFSKCIRCYACRQVCPFCYCEQCIAEENQPQWIERAPSPQSNRSWNIMRAFHLVGRCTGCGECDRVCPVGIPLSLLNAKMAVEVNAAFNYVAGMDVEEPLPLVTFKSDDPDRFIR